MLSKKALMPCQKKDLEKQIKEGKGIQCHSCKIMMGVSVNVLLTINKIKMIHKYGPSSSGMEIYCRQGVARFIC